MPANFRLLLLTFPQAAFGNHVHFTAEEATSVGSVQTWLVYF